jgi:curved DNA-binding protein CbpA
MPRTHYDVLMVSPLADRPLLTVVYRHLAKRYHPDVDATPEAAARMAEINEAYAVLGDPARRAAYDEALGLSVGDPGARGASQATRGPQAARRAAEGAESAEPPPSSGEALSSRQPGPAAYGEAGPPPINPAPAGATLTFGRYRGWSLNQVARYDRDYIEWLSRTTLGRTYRRELEELLRRG